MAGLDAAYWESRTAEGASKYAARASDGTMFRNTIAGLQGAGLNPGPQYQARLQAGLQRAPERMRSCVAGKGQKWLNNTQSGISR